MVKVSIIFHSKFGHTKRMAEAVSKGAQSIEGADVRLIPVNEVNDNLDFINESEALIFGSPTYMGTISAEFKAFMDTTSKIWMKQAWKDKLAAGFVNSGWPSGDKLNTMMQLNVFAAQHGMIWVSLGCIPGNLSKDPEAKDLNLIGSFMGAMAMSPFNEKADTAPPECDCKTAEYLGKRVAELALVFKKGKE